MGWKINSQRGINSLMSIMVIALMIHLFSNSILNPISQTLFEVEAQRANTTSLQSKFNDLRNNAQDIGKKLRDLKGDKVPNHYIVVLKDTNVLSSDLVRSLAGEAINQGAALRHTYDHALGGFAIRVPNDQALEAILKIPQVDYVEPDLKVEAFVQDLPTGVNRVDGDLSSAKSGDGSGVVNVDIGIMDTGVDLSHPDLNVYRQVTFVTGTSNGNDDNGHGTSVAGIAAAKDDFQGVVGVAPGARLWSIKVLDSNGIGLVSDIIKGIDYVTQHANEIDAANLSFGGEGSSLALRTAIINSVAAGVTYTAAAGNDAKDGSSVIPASYPEVMAVSAIVDTDGKCGGLSIHTTAGNDDSFADFSNFGPVIDMAAPGVLIKTTTRGSSYTNSFSGTSASTPHVTGAAALYKSENPGSTPSDIRNALMNLGSSAATVCDGNGHGYFTGDPDNNAEPLLYVGTSSVSGQYQYAPSLSLTGSNYHDEPSSPSIQLSQFSAAAWFKTSSNFGSSAYIVNKGGIGSDSSGQNMNYGIWMTSSERISAGFETSTGADQFVTSPNTYNDGQWHYAVVTNDGTTLRLYIDGIEVGTKSTSGASPESTGTKPVRVGANSRVTPPGNFFTGEIDEVRVWNNDLTVQQVADAFAGTSFNEPDQVLYLDFSSTPSTGEYNYAPSLALTGSNYHDEPSSSALQLSQFSAAAWFKTSTNFGSNAFIVNKGGIGSDSAGNNMNYGIWMNSAEKIVAGFEAVGGADHFVTSTDTYSDGQWHYAVVTYDGSTVILYIDGVQIDTKSTAGASPETTGTKPVRIGANSRVTPPTNFFTGEIDEVRVWNNDLTATQVAQAFGGSITTMGQVLYLPFGGSAGGYNYAPALVLTGSNLHDEPDSPSLRLSQFSVATWFKTSTNFATNGFIVNKGGSGSDSAGQNQNYGIWMTSSERIVAGFEAVGGADHFVTSPNAYNDGQWHYAVVTFDGSNVILYIDGAQVGTKSTSGASPETSGTKPVRIGANSRVTPPTNFFTGEVDEVRVWNDDLTAQQAADAFAGNSFNTGEQVLYLDFSSAALSGGYNYDPSLSLSGPKL